MKTQKTIIISRTDKIGDVILTLPMVNLLKEFFKNVKIVFIGNSYTHPVLNFASGIDEILEWDTLMQLSEKERIQTVKQLHADVILHVFPNKNVAKTALRAGIPIRIGTSHRLYHWLYCNKLPSFSRKNSELHEAQLNLKLLKPFGIDTIQTVEQLSQLPLFNKIPEPDEMTRSLIDYNRINVIFHPHSKGSAREWPIDHYIELCNLLSHDTYHIIFCGTQSEAQLYKPFLKKIHRPFSDAGGTLSLSQYISLISKCQALVAASTGPLHIAAATGIHAFGIYPPIRPMHAGRWAPLGKHIHILTKENSCSLCRKSTHCQCMEDILPEMVKSEIEHAFAQ